MSFIRDLAAYTAVTAENEERRFQTALNILREILNRTGSPEKAILEIHKQLDEKFDPAFTSQSFSSIMEQEQIKDSFVRAWKHYDKIKKTDYAFRFQRSSATFLCPPREEFIAQEKEKQKIAYKKLGLQILLWITVFTIAEFMYHFIKIYAYIVMIAIGFIVQICYLNEDNGKKRKNDLISVGVFIFISTSMAIFLSLVKSGVIK